MLRPAGDHLGLSAAWNNTHLEDVPAEVRMRLIDGHEEGHPGLELQQVEHKWHQNPKISRILLGQSQHHSLNVHVLCVVST